jgi:excisionase family DNA binding protein
MPGNVQVYTKQALAKHCGLSESTIERAVKNGSLKAFRVGTAEGGRVMIFEEDAIEWLTANPVHGGAK